MKIHKSILVMFCFFSAVNAAAATLTVAKDIRLNRWDEQSKQNYVYSIFSEENPGVLEDSILDNGCTVYAESRKTILRKGAYEVMEDRQSSPDVWDRRWHRHIKLSVRGGEFSVSCKTINGWLFNPINSDYISKVSGEWLLLE